MKGERGGRGQETYEAFHAKSSMNDAPNVPQRNPPASRPALFRGSPLGKRPIMRAAPRIVGRMQRIMIVDRSRHLSEKWPTSRTVMRPIAPPGAFKINAWRGVYPKVVRRILEKFDKPPLGIALRSVHRHINQTRTSFRVSNT